ncbi:MAG: NAD(P)/FAD-dependent oxidoreductase [Candidatus Promineifilaceae bacterium]|nr:NAD(P)/FAD-dependent oxidoreductase [Candidatus Promineifilaceae bacterium]
MERDVIVVGAGPAGATAAMSLAQKGYDVLMLDRKQFPRDKACGDGIPASALTLLFSLGMEEKIRNANFYHVDKIRLVSPKGYMMDAELEESRFPIGSAVVPRTEFDALLQQHAVDSGAEFVQGQVKEPIVEDGQVKGVRARVNGSTKEFRSPLVIGADGVTSTIARALRPDEHEDEHRAVALRAYAEDIEELPHSVEFYLYEEILPGYAWIFPTGEGQANIGLGMRLDKFRDEKHNLNDLLDRFMEMPDIKKRFHNGSSLRDVATWQLNFGSQKHIQRAYDGAMLIGDAAGLINPLTGGGISNALVSARLATETAHAAFLKEDFTREALQTYDVDCVNVLWPTMRRSYMLQRATAFLPFIVDWIIKRAQSSSEFAQTFMTKL